MASVSDEWLVTVCRDDFRSTLYNASHSKLSHTAEKLITEMEADVVERALRQGHNVIEHSMNLRNSYVRAWMELAARVGAEFEIKDFTDVDVDTCLERDSGREHSVGSKVILDLYQRFIYKKPYPLPVPEVKYRYQPYVNAHRDTWRGRTIIVDIDGTVAMNDGHRGWYEYDKVADDKYHEDITDLVHILMANGDVGYLVFLSGRSEDCRDETTAWLDKEFWAEDYELYMRASGDHRDDAIVKYELFDKHLRDRNIWLVLDDRDRVVKMWRDLGVRCLQVAPGNF
jgi:predicted kinase